MPTTVITGAASGIGAATARRLRADGHRVIGIDLRGADIDADLGTPAGRDAAIARVGELSGGVIDGFVPFAGLGPATGRGGARLVAVNYFGATALLEGLRPQLAAAEHPAAVLVSSNSATCQPDWPVELAEACLSGDEHAARELGDKHGSVQAYPATKTALAWYTRQAAVTEEWIGAGIRLNAVAPGLVETPMTSAMKTDPLTAEGMARYPLPRGRVGTPEEVAALVAFLLGAESRYCVGTVLFADGGTDALLRGRDWPAVWQPGGAG